MKNYENKKIFLLKRKKFIIVAYSLNIIFFSLRLFHDKILGSCKFSDHVAYNFRPVPNTDQGWSGIDTPGLLLETMVWYRHPWSIIRDHGLV
jgi:hypothetical protein